MRELAEMNRGNIVSSRTNAQTARRWGWRPARSRRQRLAEDIAAAIVSRRALGEDPPITRYTDDPILMAKIAAMLGE